jgi:hypothetical protein
VCFAHPAFGGASARQARFARLDVAEATSEGEAQNEIASRSFSSFSRSRPGTLANAS